MSKHIFVSQASMEMAWNCYNPNPQTKPVSDNDDANVKNHQYRALIRDKTADSYSQRTGTNYSSPLERFSDNTLECGSSNTSQHQPSSFLEAVFLAPENMSPQGIEYRKPTIAQRNGTEKLADRVVGQENSHEVKPHPVENGSVEKRFTHKPHKLEIDGSTPSTASYSQQRISQITTLRSPSFLPTCCERGDGGTHQLSHHSLYFEHWKQTKLGRAWANLKARLTQL